MRGTVKLRDLTLRNMILLVSYIAVLILGLIYFDEILGFLGLLLDIINPFIIGFMLAFILNIPMKFFIKKLPIQNAKTKQIISATLSLLLIFAIVVISIIVILPQIIENVKLLIQNLPSNLNEISMTLEKLLSQVDISYDIVEKIETFQETLVSDILTSMTAWVPSIALGVTHFTSSIVNIFMGVVMAVYMLFSKEKLLRQMRKLTRACLNDEQAQNVREVVALTSRTFENFVAGQLTESVIIGVLCYIGCIFLDIPYASIAALVIGFTNIIPYFGPIIGAAISSILILLVSPVKAIIFIIFSSLLQQFESNLIYPHVVGGSVGLSALWVLFAVSVGGGLFGIPGMILGLPTFSVIYELVKRWTNMRIQEKEAQKKKIVEEA